MMNDRLSTIMTKNVITVKPTDTLATVKDILFSRGFHHVPVVEDKKLCGIITSYDMVRLDLPFSEYENIIVKDIMNKKVVTLTENELIGAAAQIFLKHLFHGLPIVNNDDELTGIVTTHDILKYEFLREYPDDIFVKKTKWIETAKY
jgi:CBS domain-containing protein